MNGFTAITAETLSTLDLEALDQRFFFETDLLVHLTRQGARIAQIPMPARYGTEKSNLGPAQILKTFPKQILAHLRTRIRGEGDNRPLPGAGQRPATKKGTSTTGGRPPK